MIDNLSIALMITGIGAGLVFIAIILLWIMMALLVRLTADKQKTIDNVNSQVNINREELRRKVAAVAVSIALNQESEMTPHEFPLPSTALVSAWQAVMRTDILRRRGKTR